MRRYVTFLQTVVLTPKQPFLTIQYIYRHTYAPRVSQKENSGTSSISFSQMQHEQNRKVAMGLSIVVGIWSRITLPDQPLSGNTTYVVSVTDVWRHT